VTKSAWSIEREERNRDREIEREIERKREKEMEKERQRERAGKRDKVRCEMVILTLLTLFL